MLILKDSNVLDDEEEDELVSVQKLEESKRKKRLRDIEKSKYSFYEEEMNSEDEVASKPSILHKYDKILPENEVKHSFTIGDEEQRKEDISTKIKEASNSLITEASVMNDFLLPEEVKFKKTRKRKNIREKDTNGQEEFKFDSTKSFVDDDDLQAALSKSRTKALKEFKKDLPPLNVNIKKSSLDGSIDESSGLVISETTEFLDFVGSKKGKESEEEVSVEQEPYQADDIVVDEPIEVSSTNIQPLLSEPVLSKGVGAVLSLLQQRGELDRKHISNAPSKSNTSSFVAKNKDDEKDRNYNPQIELVYKDEYGREVSPKEAFKHLSHRFHGNAPGKMKTDKKLKKISEELRSRQSSSLDTPLSLASTSQEIQKKSGQAHIVLGIGSKK